VAPTHNSSRDTKPKPRKANAYTREEDCLSPKIQAGINLKEKESRRTNKPSKSDELVVLWTSGDREVALKMAFMYAFNCKRFKWGWKEVSIIVWGPSAKLLAADTELQEHVVEMKEAGVKLLACKKCSDMYGVSHDLRQLGVEVKYMGKPLTDYLRDDNYRVITI
jgi:hypothetical protein